MKFELSQSLPKFSKGIYNSVTQEMLKQQRVKAFSCNRREKLACATAMVVATAMIIGTLAVFRSGTSLSSCVSGFYDDWACSICENGKWNPSACIPDYRRYHALIESCLNGDKISGCFKERFYRELTTECKENPTAALCNRNYNHTQWVNDVNQWVNIRRFS